MAEPLSEGAAEPASLLLVDDDDLILQSLGLLLEDRFRVHTAASRWEARRLLQRLPAPPQLALVDLGLPPVPHDPQEGFALIGELLAFNRGMKILVLSGQNERSTIQHALTLGAVDFVPKPCDPGLLAARLQHQLMILEAEAPPADAVVDTGQLLGDSAAMQTLRELIRQFAASPFPVLVEGESGTGKELVAQCLHSESPRARGPMLSINCAAFAPELLEAQLFGHARGAFTGAAEARAGFFEEAAEGTLFLDEIGDFPLHLQPKLLRVLESGEYYRLGETAPRESTARVVAATNRDLRQQVRGGEFRQDLYHRLSVLTVRVPPLRERPEDAATLFGHFCRLYAASGAPFELTPGARAALQAYPFPGNVRELRNIVIRLGAKYPGQAVSEEALLGELDLDQGPQIADAADLRAQIVREHLRREGFRLDDAVAGWERAYIDEAMRQSGGNLSRAARSLGINRTTLYSRMERLGQARQGEA